MPKFLNSNRKIKHNDIKRYFTSSKPNQIQNNKDEDDSEIIIKDLRVGLHLNNPIFNLKEEVLVKKCDKRQIKREKLLKNNKKLGMEIIKLYKKKLEESEVRRKINMISDKCQTIDKFTKKTNVRSICKTWLIKNNHLLDLLEDSIKILYDSIKNINDPQSQYTILELYKPLQLICSDSEHENESIIVDNNLNKIDENSHTTEYIQLNTTEEASIPEIIENYTATNNVCENIPDNSIKNLNEKKNISFKEFCNSDIENILRNSLLALFPPNVVEEHMKKQDRFKLWLYKYYESNGFPECFKRNSLSKVTNKEFGECNNQTTNTNETYDEYMEIMNEIEDMDVEKGNLTKEKSNLNEAPLIVLPPKDESNGFPECFKRNSLSKSTNKEFGECNNQTTNTNETYDEYMEIMNEIEGMDVEKGNLTKEKSNLNEAPLIVLPPKDDYIVADCSKLIDTLESIPITLLDVNTEYILITNDANKTNTQLLTELCEANIIVCNDETASSKFNDNEDTQPCVEDTTIPNLIQNDPLLLSQIHPTLGNNSFNISVAQINADIYNDVEIKSELIEKNTSLEYLSDDSSVEFIPIEKEGTITIDDSICTEDLLDNLCGKNTKSFLEMQENLLFSSPPLTEQSTINTLNIFEKNQNDSNITDQNKNNKDLSQDKIKESTINISDNIDNNNSIESIHQNESNIISQYQKKNQLIFQEEKQKQQPKTSVYKPLDIQVKNSKKKVNIKNKKKQPTTVIENQINQKIINSMENSPLANITQYNIEDVTQSSSQSLEKDLVCTQTSNSAITKPTETLEMQLLNTQNSLFLSSQLNSPLKKTNKTKDTVRKRNKPKEDNKKCIRSLQLFNKKLVCRSKNNNILSTQLFHYYKIINFQYENSFKNIFENTFADKMSVKISNGTIPLYLNGDCIRLILNLNKTQWSSFLSILKYYNTFDYSISHLSNETIKNELLPNRVLNLLIKTTPKCNNLCIIQDQNSLFGIKNIYKSNEYRKNNSGNLSNALNPYIRKQMEIASINYKRNLKT